MKHTSAILASLAGLLLLAGCGMNPMSNDKVDSAAQYAGEPGVQSATQSMPDEFETSTYEDGTDAKADMTDPAFAVSKGGFDTQAAIQPAFWFRLIRSHERRFTIEFDRRDSNTVVANVKVTDRLLGTFNVITKPDTTAGEITERSWIRKPLKDTGIRKAVFVRHRLADTDETEDREDGFRDGWSPWRLAALSAHEITSDGGTRAIQSVRIQSEGVDVTITDPLALLRRGELPRIAPGAPVHVTATTGDATDVLVLYARWGRMRMRPTGTPGQWEARFLAPSQGGLRHHAVNALSHGTIFDDALPYDSKAWALPFRVATGDVATN
jgi:hypothetical protein